MIADLQTQFPRWLGANRSTTYTRIDKFLPIAARCLLAIIALAGLTFVAFRLKASSAEAALLYFFFIVLFSLWTGFIPSVGIAVLAVCCFNYFFAPPIFSLSVSKPLDVTAVIAFSVTALVIGRLVSRVKERTAALERANEQLRAEIAERKRAEDALLKSEEQWRDVFENNPTMYFVVDALGNVLSVNPFGAEQLGYRVEELVGHSVLNVFSEADCEAAQKNIARCMAQPGRSMSWEIRKLRKDGAMLWVRETAKAVARQGKPILLIACEDITERKQAEERLRSSEAFLAEGQRISHTGTWGWNLSTGEAVWSEEHFRIFGLDPKKTKPSFKFFLEMVHAEDRPRVKRDLDKAIRERNDFDMEFRIALADGSIKHVQGVGHPVEKESGEVDDYIGTTVDITARKHGEALLAGEKRLLEMVARGDSLPLILNGLCRLVEELASGALSSILLFEPNGNRLRHGAAPSLPKAYIDAIDGLVIGPAAGSCGTAAYRAKPVIVSEIAKDPLWANFRDVAVPHGLRACWSSPILSSDGRVLGTFAIYYREPRSPTPEQCEIIEQITHLASIALEQKRAESALRASEQVARGQVEALAQNLDILATTPAPENLIGQMLSTIGRFLNAQSVVLWLLDQRNSSLVWRAAAEGENFAASDAKHPFIKDPWVWKSAPWLREMFFTGVPAVIENLEEDPRVSSDMRDYFGSKGTRKLLEIPTLVGGDVKGFIGIRHGDRPPYRPEEIELAQALAHQAMFAIQFNQFAEQSQQAAVLEERNRMARDMHDTLAQGFTGVILQLEAAEDSMSCGQQKEADKHLHRAAALARQSLSEARRSVHALRPDALQRDDLWEALKGIIKRTTAGTPLHTTFARRGKLPALPPIWQENLLHIGQEALSNTLKYAHARNFRASLRCNAKGVRLELRDDGAGFELQDQTDGLGLTGMHERVEQMNGELEITSARGQGTNVIVALPLNQELML